MSDTINIPQWMEIFTYTGDPSIVVARSKDDPSGPCVDLQADAFTAENLPAIASALVSGILLKEFGSKLSAQWPLLQAKAMIKHGGPVYSEPLLTFLNRREALNSAPLVSIDLAAIPAVTPGVVA